jgi:hypothetical protein
VSPELVLAILGFLGTAVASGFLYLGTRGKTRTDAKSSLDARIDARVASELARVYERLDEQDRLATARAAATARLLRQIADQWAGDPNGPKLDPDDLRLIADTIPPQWIRRGSTTKESLS